MAQIRNSFFFQEMFCNHLTVGSRNCSVEFCECTYRLHVDLGDVVEFILIDEGVMFNANHPFHLHGYSFYVLGMDRVSLCKKFIRI